MTEQNDNKQSRSYVVSTHFSTVERNRTDLDRELQQFLFKNIGYRNLDTTDPLYKEIASAISNLTHVSIQKPQSEYIDLIEGGVVNDRHLYKPCLVRDNLFLKRRINEVNIFTSEELDRLNQMLGTNVLPGSVGENILTTGINIDSLPFGTLLQIGDAVVRIAGHRSFCFKFVNTFIKKEIYRKSDFMLFNRKTVGMATQVIVPGRVKPGDTISIVKLGSGPYYRPELRNEMGEIVKFELFKVGDPELIPQPFFEDRSKFKKIDNPNL